MAEIKKIAEITGINPKDLKEVVEILENKGFLILDKGKPYNCGEDYEIFKMVKNT